MVGALFRSVVHTRLNFNSVYQQLNPLHRPGIYEWRDQKRAAQLLTTVISHGYRDSQERMVDRRMASGQYRSNL